MFRDKKVLKIVEQKFMGFMGLKERPANNVTKHNVKVPDHLWKLYYKWSDENYQDHDKENADTARLFHHEGKFFHSLKHSILNSDTERENKEFVVYVIDFIVLA